MTIKPIRYRSSDEDSGRWDRFVFRDGDIVISTRSKSGTTWLQTICALLVFKTPVAPAPIADLSPWLDWTTAPIDEVVARLDAQPHRRFIKTHTSLDGVPLDPRATYLVIARHPLDAAVSMYYHQGNLNRHRWRELIAPQAGDPPGGALEEPSTGSAAPPAEPASPDLPLHDWLLRWIDDRTPVTQSLEGFAGTFHHLRDAWYRRAESNVVLLHYADLKADLAGQMRALAERLGEEIPEPAWPTLVEAATFTSMRARAEELVPDRSGIVRDPRAFFRAGRSGSYAEVLTPDELAHYHARAQTLAPPDLLAWLHRG